MRGGQGHPPRADADVDRGRFVARPVDQRGSHVGGDTGVPRGTQPLARCAFSVSLRGEVAAEGAFGNDHPARRVVRCREWAEPGLRGDPGALGGAGTWWLRVCCPVVRRLWSSSHTGLRAPGPSGPMCGGCQSRARRRRRNRLGGIAHGSRSSRGNQGFRGSRIGGNHSLAATSGREVRPRPARPGPRSRCEGGSRVSPLKSRRSWGKLRRCRRIQPIGY
jgi:hypothetical protein